MTTYEDEWTPESIKAIQLCKEWRIEVGETIPCDVYLFGSAIYQGGDQFDPQLSDLDLVVVFQEELDATERASRLHTLKKYKNKLEVQMVPRLHRSNCTEPGASVVPIEKIELSANIHKSGARRFFDRNIFYNLSDERLILGLPGAGSGTFPDEARQALEYAQKVRNQFLSVCANGNGGIPYYDGADPVPKALVRGAAQLVPDAEEGEWYDTRLGLEYLYEELSRRRGDSLPLQKLYKKVSIRRGGRGQRKPLSDEDQLLLAEILYDLAVLVSPEPVVSWEIRFAGPFTEDLNRQFILAELRRLVPDAEILGIFSGSIIIRLRSSKRSYETVRRLHTLQILPQFFDVETVQITEPGGVGDFSTAQGADPVDQVADHIARWRPRPSGMRSMESQLADWLSDWKRHDQSFKEISVSREVSVGDASAQMRADFVIDIIGANKSARMVVELARLRRRGQFFIELERLLRLKMPAILVLVGSDKHLAEFGEDIQKLAKLNAQVKIVTVSFDGE